MKTLTLEQAALAVNGKLTGDGTFTGVYTDSRKPVPGGLFIALERLILPKKDKLDTFLENKGIAALFHTYLVLCVNFGFVLFYFTDMSRLGEFSRVLFGFGQRALISPELTIDLANNCILFAVAILLCTPIFGKIRSFSALLEKDSAAAVYVTSVVKLAFVAAVLIICTVLLVGNSFNPFLYFRF